MSRHPKKESNRTFSRLERDFRALAGDGRARARAVRILSRVRAARDDRDRPRAGECGARETESLDVATSLAAARSARATNSRVAVARVARSSHVAD